MRGPAQTRQTLFSQILLKMTTALSQAESLSDHHGQNRVGLPDNDREVYLSSYCLLDPHFFLNSNILDLAHSVWFSWE